MKYKTKEQYEKEFDFQRKVLEYFLSQDTMSPSENQEMFKQLIEDSKSISEQDAVDIIEETKQSVWNSRQKKSLNGI